MRTETDLLKELRSMRRELSLLSRKQDIILKAMIPEVEPTSAEMRMIKSRKRFVGERVWRKAFR